MNRRGYSLIEVVLALGVVSFCLTTLVGLIPLGLHSQSETLEETQAAVLASSIAEDLRNATAGAKTPRYKLGDIPVAGGSTYKTTEALYYKKTGEAVAQKDAFYALTVVVTPPTVYGQPYLVRVVLDWPAIAVAKNRSGHFEIVDAFRLEN